MKAQGFVSSLIRAVTRLATSLRGRPHPDSLDSAGHGRSVIFPDHGLRPDAGGQGAFFDSINLCLALPADLRVEPERELTTRGDFEAAQRIARDKLFLMGADQRLAYMFQVTEGLHELRHLHDYFGTTWGFMRLQQVFRDGLAFNKLWQELKRRGNVKLPLVVWGRSDDAPDVLKSYLAERRIYVEGLHVLDGTVPSTNVSESGAEQVALVYSFKGLNASIPGVPLNMTDGATGQKFQKFLPLGLRALMEGTAFVMQLTAVRQIFGRQYFEPMKKAMQWAPRDNDQRLYYMAVDLYLTKQLGKFYIEYQLALSDLAMMADDTADLSDTHPGLRLSLAAAAAKSLGPTYQQQGVDLGEYVNKVARNLGWKSVKTVAKEAVVRIKKVMSDLEASPEADTHWPRILLAAYRLHLLFMTLRTRVPDFMVDRPVYVKWLAEAPPPPATETVTGTTFRALTEDDANAFLMWYLVEHVQRQLLFSRRLPCPERHAHRCPGDPLTTRHWTPAERCPFSRFVTQMGIPDLRIEQARP